MSSPTPWVNRRFSSSVNEEVEEGPAPNAMLVPDMEEYAGLNIPYRGTEMHGVDPRFTTLPPDEETEGGVAYVVPPDEEKPDPDPVPVRIVQESSDEYDDWHTDQMMVSAKAIQIVGRDRRRSSLTIKNLSTTNTLYVGKEQAATNYAMGFPIDPGSELSLSSTEAVWGRSGDGEMLIAILVETTVG